LGAYEEARKLVIVPDASTVPETELEVRDISTLERVARGSH